MQETIHTHLALPAPGSRPLGAAGGPDPYATEMVELLAGQSWAGPAMGTDIQVLVADGDLDWGSGKLGRGGFVRFDWSADSELRTELGCRLLIKSGPPTAGTGADSALAVDPAIASWSPGQGNLRVLPLDSRNQENTALVHWPEGERFLPHRHFGGEEIFVLSGTFQDEHGSYPAGTWIQSPHGSVHHPFVVEETMIWVKTGHLPPASLPKDQGRNHGVEQDRRRAPRRGPAARAGAGIQRL